MRISLAVSLLLITCPAYGQEKPVGILKIPVQYLINNTGEIAKSNAKRDDIQNRIVYSDRADNKTYTDKTGKAQFKTAGFLDAFWVAEDEGNYIHLYKLDSTEYQLEEGTSRNRGKMAKLVKGIDDYGWAPKDKLLLWSRALTANNELNLTRRAVFFEPERSAYANGQYVCYSNPFSIGSPASKKVDVPLLYIFKQDAGNNLLVGYCHKTSDRNIKDDILGWIKSDDCQYWDNRLCLEPNWSPVSVANRKAAGIKASVFVTKQDAISFRNGNRLSAAAIYDSDPYESRMAPDKKRLLILQDFGDGICEVAYLPYNTGKSNYFKRGFVSMVKKTLNHEDTLYTKILYLTLEELSSMRTGIGELNLTGSGSEIRKKLKNAFRQILINYLGDKGANEAIKNNTDLDYVVKLITGLPANNSLLRAHRINDFDDTQKMNDGEVLNLQKFFANSFIKLSRALSDDDLIETEPWGKFYWIEEGLLP